jgi:hypothetical protein
MTATIYRVIEETIYNPGGSRYRVEGVAVLYCGTDRDEARVVYYRHEIETIAPQPGQRGSRIRFQRIRQRSSERS